MFNICFRGAIDTALTSHAQGPGCDSRWRKLFSFLFGCLVVLFCFFFKSYFHFLTDSKYASRLIAGSLSAFISKTISP